MISSTSATSGEVRYAAASGCLKPWATWERHVHILLVCAGEHRRDERGVEKRYVRGRHSGEFMSPATAVSPAASSKRAASFTRVLDHAHAGWQRRELLTRRANHYHWTVDDAGDDAGHPMKEGRPVPLE